jgi:hypothetical protein
MHPKKSKIPEKDPIEVAVDRATAATAAAADKIAKAAKKSMGYTAPSDGSCVSITSSVADAWCQDMCPSTAGCPATMCKCGEGAAQEKKEALRKYEDEMEKEEEERRNAIPVASPIPLPGSAAAERARTKAEQATAKATQEAEKMQAKAAQQAQAISSSYSPTIDESCVSTAMDTVNDNWCQTICPTPMGCPADMCKCGKGAAKERAKAQREYDEAIEKQEKLSKDAIPEELRGDVQDAIPLPVAVQDAMPLPVASPVPPVPAPTLESEKETAEATAKENEKAAAKARAQAEQATAKATQEAEKMQAKAAQQAETYAPAVDLSCVSTATDTVNDNWCQTICPTPMGCPADMCKCGKGAEQERAKAQREYDEAIEKQEKLSKDAIPEELRGDTNPVASPLPATMSVASPLPIAPVLADQPLPVAPVLADESCLSVSTEVTDSWCKTTCPTGVCPPSLCHCIGNSKTPATESKPLKTPEEIEQQQLQKVEAAAAQAEQATAKAMQEAEKMQAKAAQQAQAISSTYTPPIDATCVSKSTLAVNDNWCQTICPTLMGCPASLCKCGGSQEGEATAVVDIPASSPVPLPAEQAADVASARAEAATEVAAAAQESDVAIARAEAATKAAAGAIAKEAQQVAKYTVPPDSSCVSISNSASDEWCQNTCPNSAGCPANMCQCGVTSPVLDKEALRRAATSSSAIRQAPPDASCKSVSAHVNDYWCAMSCPKGTCPPPLCRCSGPAHSLRALSKTPSSDGELVGDQSGDTIEVASAMAEAAAAAAAAAAARASKQANQQASTTYTPHTDTSCVSISPGTTDNWCQTMCPTGTCPAEMCKCEGQDTKQVLRKDQEAAASPSPLASPAPLIKARSSAMADARCVSVSAGTTDYWCATNCPTGICPSTMCKCSGGK